MSAAWADRLVILDVGHGSCSVLHDKGQTAVIDTGTGSALLEYLTKEGIGIIDLILLSHADEDHIGGLLGIIANPQISVRKVYVNSDALKNSKLWDDILYELDKNEKLVIGLTNSSNGFRIGDTTIRVLAPSAYLAGKSPGSIDRTGRRITSNSISAVLHLSHKEKKVAVFTGDIDKVGLDNWLGQKSAGVTAPILIFPHHGGGLSSKDIAQFTQALVDYVNPLTVVFSIGFEGRNSIKPDRQVIAAIRSSNQSIRIICTQISKHCSKELPKIEPTHLMSIHAQGREQGRCCIGSIIINLKEPENILPAKEAHQIFIQNAIPSPLCMS